MSGILRSAAPLTRHLGRVSAMPKGPIARQTRGMACACPDAPVASFFPTTARRERGWLLDASRAAAERPPATRVRAARDSSADLSDASAPRVELERAADPARRPRARR
eukprot:12612-Pelagococcus_subviridis.AAC.2